MSNLVSIVIPCYNQGQYVDDAVESILNQTYDNTEIIIVNDGSTDPDTIEKLKNYSKPKTRVLHKKNGHLASARNFGIKHAKADFVLLLDADDKFESTFLEKAVNILQLSPEVGFVCSYYRYFGKSDEVVTNSRSGGIENYLLSNNNVACALIRKQIWEAVGGYDEEMKRGYEDWDFWLRVTNKGWNCHVIEEPLFFYRVSESSMVTESRKIHNDLFKELVEKNLGIFRDHIVSAIVMRDKKIYELRNKISRIEKNPVYKLLKSIRNVFSNKIGPPQ
jgi:glycosyltransferase involved in cell wall biosynthesis